MVDDVKKTEAARQERIRQQAIEKAKPKAKESEFDKQLKKGLMPQTGQAAKETQKPITEQAMEEAAKRHDRQREMREKDREERKEKKEGRETGERADAKVASQKVVGKGARGEGGGQGRGGKYGGFGGSASRRGLSTKLSKAGVKNIPLDLQKQFAAKMAQAAKQAGKPSEAALAQQVLDKIVQYVRIGINRAGDKEIQMDLHQKIFRGLKLRVIAREGKVGVHFRTADENGRKIFEKNSDAIRDALSKKGIEVDEITVT